MIGIEDKVAVITGGSKGIGKATAKELAKFGAKIVIAARDERVGEKTIKELSEITKNCIFQKTDITKYNQVEALISKAVEEFGSIDFMVNNAGFYIGDLFINIKREDWFSVFDVNLNGLFYCSQIAAREMVKRGNGGRIINISSIIGIVGEPECSTYTASKGAVISLTKNMAIDLAKYGILVNSVAPGMINTEINEYYPDKERRKITERIPLNRWGEPEEIAKSVVFLCSDLSTYVTGEILVVDGGLLSRQN